MVGRQRDQRRVLAGPRLGRREQPAEHAVEAHQLVHHLLAVGAVGVADAVGGGEADRQQVRRVVRAQVVCLHGARSATSSVRSSRKGVRRTSSWNSLEPAAPRRRCGKTVSTLSHSPFTSSGTRELLRSASSGSSSRVQERPASASTGFRGVPFRQPGRQRAHVVACWCRRPAAADSYQYAASARGPAIRIAERSLPATPTTREPGEACFRRSPTVRPAEARGRGPAPGAGQRSDCSGSSTTFTMAPLSAVVPGVCDDPVVPRVAARQEQRVARTGLAVRVAVGGVREDGALVAQPLQAARVMRREAVEVVEPHLVDRDEQHQPGRDGGGRGRRRLGARGGRRERQGTEREHGRAQRRSDSVGAFHL